MAPCWWRHADSHWAQNWLTFMADLAAYHRAPIMLRPNPTLFHTPKRKSPKANAPTMVMITFFRLPAVLVMMGSFTLVHTKVEWLTVSPNMQLRPMDTCTAQGSMPKELSTIVLKSVPCQSGHNFSRECCLGAPPTLSEVSDQLSDCTGNNCLQPCLLP